MKFKKKHYEETVLVYLPKKKKIGVFFSEPVRIYLNGKQEKNKNIQLLQNVHNNYYVKTY